MDLLQQWAEWRDDDFPFLLDADRPFLTSERSRRSIVLFRSWSDAYRDSDFCAPDDTRLHLGLLPQPFVGDLQRATVFILSLNPGHDPTNYYGEYEVPEYRRALLANLKQEFGKASVPFLSLDPRFSWHGGFRWWHAKLAGVIEWLAKEVWKVPFSEARARLARELVSIELLPYHSAKFRDADKWLEKLTSVNLAREFVKDVVIPRARDGKAVVIVTRQVKAWKLPEDLPPNVIRYNPAEAQAAHLSPNSRGGRAILDHLRSIPFC